MRERAGVLVVRNGCVALIERQRADRHYWAIPGGAVKPSETIADAALREAEEELGVPVDRGDLRVRLDHRERDGSMQRQWYFEATVYSAAILINGPEIANAQHGTYRAVWTELDDLDVEAVHPVAVARLIAQHRGKWPRHVIEVDEK